jgi:hypothetical protein
MKLNRTRVFVLMLASSSCGCLAQYRDEQPVIAPVPKPPAAKRVDIAPLFAQAYRESGSPRIVLMWNRELSDKSQSAVVDKQTTRETGASSSNALEKTTQGTTGSATLKNASESFDRTKTVSSSRAPELEAARPNALSERNAAMLQRVFVDEMNRGGVQFVDRALAIRLTAASLHRAGGDSKLIETDALLAHADLLIEVLMIEDKDAPCGYGFDVRAKDLKRGVEITSVYSRAMPPPVPDQPGRWVAGAGDYVFKTSAPVAGSPNAAQVGSALARDVMFTLGSTFEAANRSAAPRRQR